MGSCRGGRRDERTRLDRGGLRRPRPRAPGRVAPDGARPGGRHSGRAARRPRRPVSPHRRSPRRRASRSRCSRPTRTGSASRSAPRRTPSSCSPTRRAAASRRNRCSGPPSRPSGPPASTPSGASSSSPSPAPRSSPPPRPRASASSRRAAAVGDRFSALSAAALVPAGLAGADLAELLDEAESEELNLAIDDPSNNGLRLAGAARRARAGRARRRGGRHPPRRLRPVGRAPARRRRAARPRACPWTRRGSRSCRCSGSCRTRTKPADPGPREVLISGSLGELLLVLQYTAALLARLRGTDPFGGSAAPTPTPSEDPR